MSVPADVRLSVCLSVFISQVVCEEVETRSSGLASVLQNPPPPSWVFPQAGVSLRPSCRKAEQTGAFVCRRARKEAPGPRQTLVRGAGCSSAARRQNTSDSNPVLLLLTTLPENPAWLIKNKTHVVPLWPHAGIFPLPKEFSLPFSSVDDEYLNYICYNNSPLLADRTDAERAFE